MVHVKSSRNEGFRVKSSGNVGFRDKKLSYMRKKCTIHEKKSCKSTKILIYEKKVRGLGYILFLSLD